jgi:DNA-binding MarR family transcriptional regulator
MSQSPYAEQLFNSMLQLRKLMMPQATISHKEKLATLLQYAALTILKMSSDYTLGDLGNAMHLSKSSSTQLVERLVKSGYVQRVPDETDRRVVHLQITQEGKTEVEVLKKKLMEKINTIIHLLPEKDIKELIRIQTDLINALKSTPTT